MLLLFRRESNELAFLYLSRIVSGSRVAAFSSSAVSFSRPSKSASTRTKKNNIARSAGRLKDAAESRPSVVLGTRTAEEAEKWGTCKLSKALVDAEKLRATALTRKKFPVGIVHMPRELGYGIRKAEKKLLFEYLPEATQHMTTPVGRKECTEAEKNEVGKVELRKANLLAKALDLTNANAAGIAFENRRRIIETFSTPKEFDPGRTEVQVALLTYRIRNMWNHLITFRRDVGNRRNLRRLIHDRASLLSYLKGHDRRRYDVILEQLALEPESVEGELVI